MRFANFKLREICYTERERDLITCKTFSLFILETKKCDLLQRIPEKNERDLNTKTINQNLFKYSTHFSFDIINYPPFNEAFFSHYIFAGNGCSFPRKKNLSRSRDQIASKRFLFPDEINGRSQCISFSAKWQAIKYCISDYI